MGTFKLGINPNLREEVELRDLAMENDLAFVITPSTLDTGASTDAWTRDVKISLQTAAGAVHRWCDMTLTGLVAIADTSTSGTATIASGSTSPSLVEGEVIITVTGANDWVATDTDTLTLSNATILGYTVTGGTSVETWTT